MAWCTQCVGNTALREPRENSKHFATSLAGSDNYFRKVYNFEIVSLVSVYGPWACWDIFDGLVINYGLYVYHENLW
jgi:hypothetical protein